MTLSPAENCPFRGTRSITACSAKKCTMTFFFGTGCMGTNTLVDKSCFCTDRLDGNGCSKCSGPRARTQYLSWLNSTCGDIKNWHGLPENWTSEIPDLYLMYVGDTTEPSTSNHFDSVSYGYPCKSTPASATCNSTYSTYWSPPSGTFCPTFETDVWNQNIYNATEAAVATFQYTKKTYSPWFTTTGRYDPSLDAGLYLDINGLCRSVYPPNEKFCGSGAKHSQLVLWASTKCDPPVPIAALMIKHAPGFGGVNVGQLILLWCTRPRLAWMIIALIPFQASNEIYFSVASSTLVAEVLLQVLGGYYMGVATNYARRQKWYGVGRLTGTAKGRDAMVMYAGSVMWLSVIVIAIATCVWSLLGLGRYVTAIASAIRGLDRQARTQMKSTAKRVASLSDQESTIQSKLVHGLELKFPDLALHFDRVLVGVRVDLESLGKMWGRLEIYVTADSKAQTAAEREQRTLRKRARRAGKNGESPPEMSDLTNESSTALITWNSTPGEQLSELGRLKEYFLKKEDLAKQRRLIDGESIAVRRILHTYQSLLGM
ncbi:hypothetical protein BCR34DRAFT_142503 [Clohesyomyces aquaticus]|uniref:Uncharacterized protein n=1 Tax=Clohesyomyces aquaticus TaxID=1231657 RepID=A0A1Y1YLI7_9PLEO|nr:hypothetical protein BCR34DRAFT_142503 [Clohesyomyces aquaticus]